MAMHMALDDCSEDRILMNLPDELLDDPDAVHSKPVENFLGNLDRHVAKTGPQGFDKVTDDLLLKYGKDLIKKNSFEWRSNENKQAAENLKVIQSLFDTKQQTLRTAGVSDSDIAIITTSNKIQRVVRQCKEDQNGPVVTTKELDELFESIKDYNKLNKALDLEIRYRKFTMSKVKNDCPLFLQRKVDPKQKLKNLKILIDSEELGLKALATMNDLASAIQEGTPKEEDEETIVDEAENDTVRSPSNGVLSLRLAPEELLMKDEFIIGIFEDGCCPGQVVTDSGEKHDGPARENLVRLNESKTRIDYRLL